MKSKLLVIACLALGMIGNVFGKAYLTQVINESPVYDVYIESKDGGIQKVAKRPLKEDPNIAVFGTGTRFFIGGCWDGAPDKVKITLQHSEYPDQKVTRYLCERDVCPDCGDYQGKVQLLDENMKELHDYASTESRYQDVNIKIVIKDRPYLTFTKE